jgi:outer membrane protein assembly factor BamB
MSTLFFLLCATWLGDWTEFRGSRADAMASNVATPLVWSDTENVAWKVEVPGLGWSSPVVDEGVVYLTTAVTEGSELSLRALALDVSTGKTIWDREIRKLETVPAIHSKNSHASPTPIVREDAIYVHFGAMGTAKLAKDGSIIWKNTELDYPHVHGCGGSPFLYEDKLFIVCDGGQDPFVVALHSSDGKIAWKRARSIKGNISHSFVTPVVTVIDGKAQLLAPGPDHFAAYDVSSGEELWHVRAPGWSVIPQPVIGHGMVFYNHDYDHPELMAVKLGGQGDITESNVVWRIKRGAPSTPTPLLIGDELYFVSDSGVASCVDAKTGKQHWTERLGGNFSASPVLANGFVLFLDENGLSHYVKPAKTFEVVQKNEVTGRTFATPAFVGEAMFLRTDKALLKIANRKDTASVNVSNVRRAFHDGHHNAFTDMCRFNGQLYLTFRSCPDGHMVHPTSSIIVLASSEGTQWKQVHQFSVPERDTRDPHFLMYQKKLFVYTGTWYSGKTTLAQDDYDLNKHLGYAVWSEDGSRWSRPIMLEGTFGHYIWRAATDGKHAFLCGRRKPNFEMLARGEPRDVESLMLESDDGLIWRKRAVFQETVGDETAFLFEPDGSILGVGRHGEGKAAQLLRAHPPYTHWDRQSLHLPIGGPLLTKWGGRMVVGGRKNTDKGPRTALYWLDSRDTLVEFAELPSDGDNSYPGFIEISPNRALVSYYSSHEKNDSGKSITAIYLADLELKTED